MKLMKLIGIILSFPSSNHLLLLQTRLWTDAP